MVVAVCRRTIFLTVKTICFTVVAVIIHQRGMICPEENAAFEMIWVE